MTKKTVARTAKYVKAGSKRAPSLVSYRDEKGKRHWRPA